MSDHHQISGLSCFCEVCNPRIDMKALINLIRDLATFHTDYINAIDMAQTMYHNCEEWTIEERKPIREASDGFYATVDMIAKLTGEQINGR